MRLIEAWLLKHQKTILEYWLIEKLGWLPVTNKGKDSKNYYR